MRYFRRRFLGFCLLPILLTALDDGLTLAGQPKEYWAGDYGQAHEMDPISHTLLVYHPLAFIAVNAALTLVLIGLILLTPRIVAAIFSIMTSLVHWAGATTWFFHQDYLNYREKSLGLALLMIICMAVGLGWGWRAKSHAAAGRHSTVLWGSLGDNCSAVRHLASGYVFGRKYRSGGQSVAIDAFYFLFLCLSPRAEAAQAEAKHFAA
jgi:hypothetical protein